MGKPSLTPEQARILRAARDTDSVIVSGIQRRPVERLVALGLARTTSRRVPSISVHGREEIRVTITRKGMTWFWSEKYWTVPSATQGAAQ